MIKLPNNSQWLQPNRGDMFGSLWGSYNINLDDLGRVSPSEKLLKNIDETDDSDLGLSVAIFKSDTPYTASENTWYALSYNGKLFNTQEGAEDPNERFWKTPEEYIVITSVSGTFQRGETITGGTSGATAIVVNVESSRLFLIDVVGTFSGSETITGGTSGATASRQTDAATDAPTDGLDALDFRGTPIVSSSTDLYKLETTTWDDSWWDTTLGQGALSSSEPHPLHVPDFVNVWLLIGDGNKLHIVTDSDTVLNARLVLDSIYEINWINSTSNRIWIGATNTLGGEGVIAEWDGSSELPLNIYGVKANKTYSSTAKDDILYTLNSKGQLLAFSGNGFKEVGRLPVANDLIEQQNSTTLSEFNELQDDAVSHRGMSMIDDKVSILVKTSPNATGTRAVPQMPSGIWQYTKEQGLVHKYGIGNNETGDENDYGNSLISEVGALEPTFDSNKLLFGAEIFTDASTTTNIIGHRTSGLKKRGYIITPKIYSNEIKENWARLHHIFKKLRKSGEEIIIKYRDQDNYTYPLNATITWASTTTFTTTTSAFSGASVGDEVEFLNGFNGGTTAHITVISETGGTYTVTIDETVTGATGTSLVRVMNWKKVNTITSQIIQNKDFTLDSTSEWIQLRIELRGVSGSYNSPEIEKIIINPNTGQRT